MTEQTRDGSELVDCPFCGESDFDLHGLKWHLQNGDATIIHVAEW